MPRLPDTVGPEPRICADVYLPGLRRLVEALASYDVMVGVQLMHPGRQVVEGSSVAPSPVPLNSVPPVPHELTAAEIAVIVARYARAAQYAREAGFTFVEVHGAHGYLPSNVLSPQHNLRTDAYGGSVENRARFSVEVARAIVDAVDLVGAENSAHITRPADIRGSGGRAGRIVGRCGSRLWCGREVVVGERPGRGRGGAGGRCRSARTAGARPRRGAD